MKIPFFWNVTPCSLVKLYLLPLSVDLGYEYIISSTLIPYSSKFHSVITVFSTSQDAFFPGKCPRNHPAF
jgi:hypothetical protein